MDIPVAIVTDVDIAAYNKVARLDVDGKAVKDESGKPIYDYVERQPRVIAQETLDEITKKEKSYNSQGVKAFVAPQWTFDIASSNLAPFKLISKSTAVGAPSDGMPRILSANWRKS